MPEDSILVELGLKSLPAVLQAQRINDCMFIMKGF